MADKEYLSQMVDITMELERIASAEPFDKADLHNTLDEFHKVNRIWFNSHRRRPWFGSALISFLLIILIWVLYKVFFVIGI